MFKSILKLKNAKNICTKFCNLKEIIKIKYIILQLIFLNRYDIYKYSDENV